MLHRLTKASITTIFYKRYVDDINSAQPVTSRGAVIRNGLQVIDETKVEAEMNVPSDKRVMNLFQHIGDSIHRLIHLEIDCPSNQPDDKLSVLD